LKDAADLIAQEFSTVMAWGALETAIERLMLAATTGTHADIRAATRSTRTRTDPARTAAALASLTELRCCYGVAACGSRYHGAGRTDAADAAGV
jgi:hypothetical protein